MNKIVLRKFYKVVFCCSFMRRINKKAQWQNYLLPAIMAVLVLGISFYFIFNEYFTGEGMDREVCKESVMVRSAMPEVKVAGLNLVSLKDDFPLKCKTNVVEVTKDDVVINKEGKRNVDNIIGDALVECWYIFGRGDANVFAASLYGQTTTCVPCARIHLTNEAKAAVVDGKIDIEGILNDVNLFDIGGKKTSYLNYLNGVGEKFYPFNPMETRGFDLGGEKFGLEGVGFWNRVDNPDFKTKLDSDVSEWGAFGKVVLPKYLDVEKGDLIISVGEVTTSADVENDYVPYMFYFQNGQDDYLKEMDKTFFQWGLTGFDTTASESICDSWEGIPA